MTSAIFKSLPTGVLPASPEALRETALTGCRETRFARILMVCPRYFPLTGGTETHVYETARRLARRGCRIGVLTTDTTGELPVREQIDGVSIIRTPAWPKWSDVRFAPGVYREIARGEWDLVHVQGYHTFVAPIAMLASIRRGLPFVVTFHSGGHSSRLRNALRRAQHLALRPLVAKAAQLIGVSRYEADFFNRAIAVSREKFHIVQNGGELPKPSPIAANTFHGSLIVSIGRLERYKGHHRAIEAMPHVLRSMPEARLRILGEGPYEQELRRLVARLQLGDRVTIGPIPSGDRQGMANLLSSAALVVLFSDYEAHPVAVMEALSLGRRVLVSNTSGLAEMVERRQARGAPIAAQAAQRARLMIETMKDDRIPVPIELPTWEDCVDRLLKIYGFALGAQVIRQVA
jgi:glycosyltransferase involved in cell wall biosynthesis